MPSLLDLWLSILLSTLAVFVISSLIHMVFKWHAFDYKGFKNEDAVRAALGADQPVQGVKYVVPYCCDMKEMATEAMKKKYADGPNAVIIFGPNGQPNMGKHLGLWFLWSLIVATVAAFLCTRFFALDASVAHRAAKLAGIVTFIAHGFGTVQESIWMYRSWRSTATYMLDALCYALGTAAVFYFLWK